MRMPEQKTTRTKKALFAVATVIAALLLLSFAASLINHLFLGADDKTDNRRNNIRDQRPTSLEAVDSFFIESSDGRLHASLHPQVMRDTSFAARPLSIKKRVFFLGGSCVYGFDLIEDEAIPSRLQKSLKVEVINAGICGANSNHLVRLAKEVAGYKPDLVLIYAGHNDARQGSAGQIYNDYLTETAKYRLADTMRRTSLGRLLAYLLDKQEHRIQAGDLCAWFRSLNGDPKFRELVEANFQENLNQYATNLRRVIIRLRKGGAKVVVFGLTSNFDFVHCTSLHRPDLTTTERDQFDLHFQQGREAYQRGDFGEAQRLMKLAAQIDPQFAEAHYWAGMSMKRQYQYDEAAVWLRRARDLYLIQEESDFNYARAPQAYNDAAARVCREASVPFIPLEDEFGRFSSTRMPDGELFLDDLHFNETGARRMAELLAKILQEYL